MTSPTDSAVAELLLKTTAPRTQPHLLMRVRLSSDDPYVRNYPVIVIQAPAGYGKTSLLAQWRREQLARGVAVIWFSSDERDDVQRFLLGLVQAVRAGCARPAFGGLLVGEAASSAGPHEGVTAWLAEVSQVPGDVLLIVDEAERLAETARSALAYILHNAPPNLRIVVAARLGLDGAIDDLLTYGQAVVVGADRLGFHLDEAITLMGQRFGARVDANACARLLQLTDGWPLGLQLAIAAMSRATDPMQIVAAIASSKGALRDHLVAALLAKLSDDDKAFLTRISIVDRLSPDLCRALTGDADAPARLAQLIRETPVFVTSEGDAWCRLHTLVREVLMVRAGQFSDEELVQLHGRAAQWLTQQGMLEEAARHAHAAGRLEIAYDLAERCLHDAVKQGRLQAVLEWLDLLPEAELERRPRLRLAAAWALALGERHEEAERQVERIEAQEKDRDLRYECALIRSAAAYYADEIDRFVEIFEPWADAPPDSSSWLAQAHANRLAARAMLLGEPAQARRSLQRVPRGEVGKGTGYLVRWGDHIAALSLLKEGRLQLARDVLSPALASAETDLGLRHPLTCMFAAMSAMQAYESNQIARAATLLANRLDVLERGGTPETLAIAYQTAARIAAAQGREHQAMELLEGLDEMGRARGQARLSALSLAEQIRMHAGRYRGETCSGLMLRIDGLIDQGAAHHGPLSLRSMTMLRTLSQAFAAIAVRDWRSALRVLGEAAQLTGAMQLGRYRVEVMALRAFALEQTGVDGRPLLLESMNLAQAAALQRTLIDAHPALADWIEREAAAADEPLRNAYDLHATPTAPTVTHRAKSAPRVVPSVVLTPKEREILELLARNFSNKEIAVAAAIGEGTVKWHLKNLFGKLDASSRKHVVHRALLLGLLANE